ncbi:phage tail domain-containing protein [Enterococcus faecium]|uniref:phage tail domain-containing protein n=1 Tax=Enterococcus faecium TaxID=1352 RepID=UPI000BF1963B|nr:phage tail domain-containing protein [Enterococcus faecium]PEH49298.1 phage tail protein [Enterococcus faecium]
MDLFIEKDNISTRMSSLGILVKDIKVTNATIESNRKKIKGKNGNLFSGATYTDKQISVVGNYYVSNELQDEMMKDRLNGLFADAKPYYITKMYSSENIYKYERPGESTGFDLLNKENQRLYHYRYKVILDGEISYDFQGFSERGLLYEVSFSFVTADIPFGITVPTNDDLTGKTIIEYKGTAPCSQLEWPFSIQVRLAKDHMASCYFYIGDYTVSYVDSTNTFKKGDILMFNGVSTTLNGVNVNDKTNYSYFVLEPTPKGYIDYHTDVPCYITLVNKVEFYI